MFDVLKLFFVSGFANTLIGVLLIVFGFDHKVKKTAALKILSEWLLKFWIVCYFPQ